MSEFSINQLEIDIKNLNIIKKNYLFYNKVSKIKLLGRFFKKKKHKFLNKLKIHKKYLVKKYDKKQDNNIIQRNIVIPPKVPSPKKENINYTEINFLKDIKNINNQKLFIYTNPIYKKKLRKKKKKNKELIIENLSDIEYDYNLPNYIDTT